MLQSNKKLGKQKLVDADLLEIAFLDGQIRIEEHSSFLSISRSFTNPNMSKEFQDFEHFFIFKPEKKHFWQKPVAKIQLPSESNFCDEITEEEYNKIFSLISPEANLNKKLLKNRDILNNYVKKKVDELTK